MTAPAEGSFYDVAIVGYGPTGATAANLLGQLGLKVAVIERDPDVFARARAISTDEEVMRIWQSAGLSERLQQDMVTDRPIAFVDASGVPFIEAHFTPHGSGHPPQQFIYQPAVDQVLRDGVSRFKNVEVMLNRECVRVSNTGDHVELLLADTKSDTFIKLNASFVIAADGGSSPIRGQLGVGYAGRTYGERWIVIDTEVLREWDGHDRLRFHCNPDRPTVDCPTPLGHHRWEYPARVGEDEEWLVTDEAVWNVLEDQGITREHVRILRAVAYSHHVRAADRWRVGRVFLAGDAAHAMPPWNGQGMSAGVRDAANLCWKLAAVVHGHAPQSILDSYQAERMPHVTEVTRRAVFAGRIITQRHRSVATLRDHLLRKLIRLPGAVEAFQRLAWIPDAHYGGGFLADQRHRAVGWQVPQPWLIDAAGAAVRLDDVLAGRWAVVHTGNLPAEAEKWLAHGVFSLRVLDPAAGPRPDGIRDSGGVLTKWMRDRKATALVLRPDGFVYAATDGASALPGPPSGLIPATQALPEPTTRSESTL